MVSLTQGELSAAKVNLSLSSPTTKGEPALMGRRAFHARQEANLSHVSYGPDGTA